MKVWIHISIVFAIIIVPMTSKAQQANCKLFHTGKYRIMDTANKSDILIDRNDSLETRMIYRKKPGAAKEAYEMQVVFRIKWIDECSYTAKLVKTVIATPKGERSLPVEKKTLTVQILKSSNDAYLEKGTFDDKHHSSYRYVVYKL
ncbi:MAG: hypothetical protein JSS96_08120 [Bacteroidetes bacterium]|nr:hypothetical protein [Bacteroidota bacterium]